MRILHLEDNPADAESVVRRLSEIAPYVQTKTVPTTREALLAVKEQTDLSRYDALLLNHHPGLDGFGLLADLRWSSNDGPPVVLIFDRSDEEFARQAVKLGATSYVFKNADYVNQLPWVLEEALFRSQLLGREVSVREDDAGYRQVFEYNRSVRLLLEPESGSIVNASPSAVEFYGYSVDELQRMKITDLTALPHGQVMSEISRAMIEERNYFTFRHRLSSGEVRDVEVHASPIEVSGRTLIFSVIHDITERRRTEERFRRFFELPLVGLAMTSPDRRFLVVNQKLCDMLGYTAAELVGMSWADVTHPEDVNANVHLLEQTLKGETDGYLMDKRFVHRNLQIVHTSISARCVRRADGSVDYLILIVQDITERKRAEVTLQVQYSISRILSESPSISEAAAQFIQVICEGFGWQLGEMWRVDRQAGVITCLESWHQPDDALAEFAAAAEQYRFARGIGLPGRIWETGKALWLSQASEAEGLPRLPLARRAGLKIVCGFPVILAGETLGVMQFFGRDRREPDQGLIEMMASICSQMGQFIERKQAEKTLQESEARYRNVVETQTELICRFLPDTTLTFVNDAYCQYFGATREELIGQSFLRLIPLADREAVRRHIASLVDQPQTETWEHEVMQASGATGWMRWANHAIVDAEGKLVEFQGVGSDVTARRQAELALKESEDQVSLFVEHAPASVAMFDREMRYIMTSRRWLTDLRLGDEPIVGRSHYEVFPEISETWKEIHQRCLAGAVERCEEDLFVRLDGTIDWIRWEVRPWYRASGEIGGVIIFSELVTERKLAEQAQRESAQRYHTLFEQANDAIFLESEDDKILEVNQRACDLFGYTREELLAKGVPELLALNIRGREGSVVTSRLKKYRDSPFETLVLHRSGKRIPVEITNTMIEENGRSVALSVVRDITERKELERRRQEQIRSIAETETQQHNFARIIGEAAGITEVIRAAQKVAASDVSPVLITGETGTGKGLVARAIHYTSKRASFAFVLIDCTSVPETLFESELFGHEKGAFTDARRLQRGRFELARGGTLFLDEISEIPLTMQGKLLQVIQEQSFQRVGGREEIALDARIIAATNRDLRAEIAAGRFRQDLYQRLFVVQLDLPALRERNGDVMRLASQFIRAYNRKYGKDIRGFAPGVASALEEYSWPGNVRELEHAIERSVFFEEGELITSKHLRIDLPSALKEEATARASSSPPVLVTDLDTLDQMNATLIKSTVSECAGNISKAARKLGISRSRIYRVLRT